MSFIKKYDLGYKALSIVLGIILWFYVQSIQNPNAEFEFKNIPVTIEGEARLQNTYGNTIIFGKDQKIRLRLRGSRMKLAQIKQEDIQITVDVSTITTAGTYPITYDVTLPVDNVTVVESFPSFVQIEIDKIVTVSVPVRVTVEGDVAEGFLLEEATATPGIIPVKGPEREISRISYAEVIVKETLFNRTIDEDLPYTLMTESGKFISLYPITHPESVRVNVPVLAQKTIPLSIDLVEGRGVYKTNAEIIISPKTIDVAGDPKDLATYNLCDLGTVDLSEIEEGEYSGTYTIALPNGIKNLSGITEAEVTVKLKNISTKYLTITDIRFLNEPPEIKATSTTRKLRIQVRGDSELVARVQPEDIRAEVDLSEQSQSSGSYSLPANIVFSNDFVRLGVTEDYSITVSIKNQG